MNTGSEPSWDGDLFRLYNKRLSADSWQDDLVDDSDGDRASDSVEGVGGYDRALFGGPGADLFGARYSAEPEASGPRTTTDSGPPSVSMPSISQPMSPISQSTPSISQPMAPISQSMPSISGSMPAIPSTDPGESEDGLDGGSLVRPYARTRGRTRTDYDLAIETLVTTSERGRAQTTQIRPEHRSISELCVEARSVAEVAAHLRLPLGVVRVLIGDMADTGLVLIHESGMVVGDRPSMEFLERVLSGLRRL
ncbi:hypothetical protein GCM10011581_01590 [Saccharopolyspora subtropica]|uniref:DUF742 domain-containing protein n=1 Tax=Saccharopolyspora thermophila TaxID=89367 RepID=A0A917JI58_9PSEU|nr:DUF742 domain-containing protein [Saccharopolyspora subtropica]GGI68353.1 hypothetical protein GCM10011581_01590 [Saccharopolyspora subtropica]